jgi:ABC-type antimicrobial peptide transport system permease subunit
MKSPQSVLVAAGVALAVGVLAGYFLFRRARRRRR